MVVGAVADGPARLVNSPVITKHMCKLNDFVAGAADKGSPAPPASSAGLAGAAVGERIESIGGE